MNQFWHLLPPIQIKLMSVEAKRAVTDRLKAYILARAASGRDLFDSWRGQDPTFKQAIKVLDVCLMSFALLDLQAISSTFILRLQAPISQEQSDEDFSL